MNCWALQSFSKNMTNKPIIINAEAVLHSPHARYVVLEETGSDWSVNMIHLPYDWSEAARLARANGREDYAVAIETGRM